MSAVKTGYVTIELNGVLRDTLVEFIEKEIENEQELISLLENINRTHYLDLCEDMLEVLEKW